MDETKILEHELVYNERVVYHNKYGEVVLFRPNPAIDKKIAEERRKVYHQDLKDDTILTSEEVSTILKKRGVWTSEMSGKMTELTMKSADLISRLTALGYETPSRMYLQIIKTKQALDDALAEDVEQEVRDALERVFDLEAEEIETSDLVILRENLFTTEHQELVDTAEILKLQLGLLDQFQTVKGELAELSDKHTKFFGDTIESRAARAERMAKLYYCARHNDEKRTALWETFEAVWEDEPTDIAWLMAQMYYFEYGLTDTQAKALETHGFMGPVTDIEDSSENSPGQPEHNSDGESQESKPQNSSVSATPTS